MFKDVWPFVTTRHKRAKTIRHIKCIFQQQTKALWGKIKFSKTNLVLSPWKIFLSAICVPSLVASNYQKVTDISPIYDLYSFLFRFILGCPFLKFGPLPSKNLDARLIKFMVSSKKCKEWMNVVNNDNRMEIVDNFNMKNIRKFFFNYF